MRFTDTEKGQIVGLVEAGWEPRCTAAHKNWSYSFVQSYVAEFKKNGKFHVKADCSGQKGCTTVQSDRLFVRSMQSFPELRKKTSEDIVEDLSTEGVSFFSLPIRRHLVKNGFHPRIAAKTPSLRAVNIQKLLACAHENVTCTVQEYAKVLWADKAPIDLFGGKKRHIACLRHHGMYHLHCIQPTVKLADGRLMVCRCFSSNCTERLVIFIYSRNQEPYRSTLIHEAKPALTCLKCEIFQQHNDAKHSSNSLLQYLNGPRFPGMLIFRPPNP